MKKILTILIFAFFQIILKSQTYSGLAPKQPDENIFLENYYENYTNNEQQKIKKVIFLEKKLLLILQLTH